MARCWLLLACIFTLSGYLPAQILTVKDAETNMPLEGVVIFFNNQPGSLVTNARGEVSLESPDENEQITLRMIGYSARTISIDELRSANFMILMEPDHLALEQVVVSATRWNQASKNVPQKITSIPPVPIRLWQPQTTADLLNTSGDVFIQKSQQGGGSPMIRGFSANRLLYAIDGVRMNTAIFRSGNLQNVISLDAFTMESTEVLFGPGSVMYGSDAIGAVMDFRTRDAKYSTQSKSMVTGDAQLRYSSANKEKTGHVHVNIGGKKWAALTSLTFTDFDDLRMGSHGPDDYLRTFYVVRQGDSDIAVENPDPEIQVPSGYSQKNLMQKIRFRPGNNWDLQYAFHYSRLGEYDRYDRLIETRNGLPRSAEWKYGPQKWDMHQFTAVQSKTSRFYDQVSIRTYYQKFEESRIDRGFNRSQRRTRTEFVDVYGFNLDLTKKTGVRTRLNYGFEYVFNDVTSTGEGIDITSGETNSVASRYPDSNWQSAAIYALLEYEINDKIFLQTGARYNIFSLDSDFSKNQEFLNLPFSKANLNNNALTGSAGLTYSVTSTLDLRLNLSSAFRAPNVDDIGKVFDSEPGSVVVPNPDLEAEYAWNAEIGIEKVIAKSVKMGVTGYYTILENAMVRRDFTLNGQDSIIYDGTLSQVQAIQNAAQSRIYGIQAGVEAILPWNISASAQLNYQKGEEELDDGTTSPSRHAAPLFGNIRLNYSHLKWQLMLYGVFNGTRKFSDMPQEEIGKPYLYAKDDNGNPYAPGWYTLNFKAMYQVSPMISATAGIENITDQRYRPYSSGMAGAGRNIILSLAARF